MSFGSDPENVTSTQTRDPPAFQMPYLNFGLQQSADRFADPKSRIAPQSPQTALALRLGEARALGGSPLLDQAQAETSKTIGGGYLGAQNPYMGQLATAVGDVVQPQIQSRFTAAGGSGSGGEKSMIASAIANAIAPQLFGSYEAERGRQVAATGMAPGMAQQDYGDIAQLSNVGATLDQQQQRQLLEPDELLDQYLKRVTGNFGASATTSQPFYPNRGAGILGGGLSGLLGANALNDLGVSGASDFGVPLGLAGALLGGFF